MTTSPIPTPSHASPAAVSVRISEVGLHDLGRVVLDPPRAEAFAQIAESLLGPPPWVARKRVEIHELMALEQISPGRVTIHAIDATTEIVAMLTLRCPVACLPPGASDIEVEEKVELTLFYPEQIIRTPLPGPSLVVLRSPAHIHHPNVSTSDGERSLQRLCLGTRIPRGFPLREALVGAYYAMTMQSVQTDERDASGVMNVAAALFWQQQIHRIPLSREPFLKAGGASR